MSMHNQRKTIAQKISLRASQLMLLLFASASAQGGAVITDVIFYNSIVINGAKQPDRPIDGTIKRNNLGRLYARFVILGSKDAIAELERNAYLSVRAEWSLNGVVLDTIEIGVSQDKWEVGESSLRKQVHDDGVFRFRTATFRTYIPIGRYKLTIRDGLGNIMAPPAFAGPGIYQPKIEVTE